MHFTCNLVDLGCVLILQGTRVQVQVLKSCKFVQETSEEVLHFKSQQLAQQITSIEV